MKCRCKADLFSKTYPNGFSKGSILNAFRKSVDIQANYTCVSSNGKQEVVTGTHHVDYFVENDNTLAAWGAEVRTTRNALLDIEKTAVARWFDPTLSNVPELKAWADKNR